MLLNNIALYLMGVLAVGVVLFVGRAVRKIQVARIGMKITNTGGEYSYDFSESWYSVSFAGLPVKPEYVLLCNGFTGIGLLSLAYCTLDEDLIRAIAEINNLSDLELSNTNVDDAMLGVIGKMSALNGLYLSHTRITDAGIDHLRHHPKLKFLAVRGCRVSLTKLEQLRDSCQDLWISNGGETNASN